MAMDEPIDYLYRVAQSKSRKHKQGFLPWTNHDKTNDIEPGLPNALANLPKSQAEAVWLVKACGFTNTEAATAIIPKKFWRLRMFDKVNQLHY